MKIGQSYLTTILIRMNANIIRIRIAMQVTLRNVFLITFIVCAILGAGLYLQSKLEPRIVASVDHPNGTRLRVVQKFEYSGDFFNTSIYFDHGDQKWRWYYFDHDDSYWATADTDINGNEVRIESEQRLILFDTLTGQCKISNQEVGNRTSDRSTQIVDLPPGLLDRSTQSQEIAK